jgi:hypothetical protein
LGVGSGSYWAGLGALLLGLGDRACVPSACDKGGGGSGGVGGCGGVAGGEDRAVAAPSACNRGGCGSARCGDVCPVAVLCGGKP